MPRLYNTCPKMAQIRSPFWYAALLVVGVVCFFAGRLTLKDDIHASAENPLGFRSNSEPNQKASYATSREIGVHPAATVISAAATKESASVAPDAKSTQDLAAKGPCPFAPHAERFQTWGVPVPYVLCIHPPISGEIRNDYVSGQIRKEGRWPECDRVDSLAKAVMPEGRKTGVIVDVGANIGSCSYLMAAQGHTVFAFEPNPANIALVRSTQAIQELAGEVILIEAGASVTRQSAATIFKDPTNSGNNIVLPEGINTGDAAKVATESSGAAGSVRLVRVDDIVQRPVDVMKMDCQGCEVRAPKGARALFMQHGVGAVVTEFSPPFLRAAGAEPVEMLRLLDEYGHEIITAENAVLPPAEFEAYAAQWAQKTSDIFSKRRVKAV